MCIRDSPSTYAPTIQTIQNREYVDKREILPQEREIVKLSLGKSGVKKEVLTEKFGGDKNKFVPTDIGEAVSYTHLDVYKRQLLHILS